MSREWSSLLFYTWSLSLTIEVKSTNANKCLTKSSEFLVTRPLNISAQMFTSYDLISWIYTAHECNNLTLCFPTWVLWSYIRVPRPDVRNKILISDNCISRPNSVAHLRTQHTLVINYTLNRKKSAAAVFRTESNYSNLTKKLLLSANASHSCNVQLGMVPRFKKTKSSKLNERSTAKALPWFITATTAGKSTWN